MFKKIIQFKLKILAKIIINKYQPRVIAITGSVGKTSAKRALSAVLADEQLRASEKSYNTELGLPLAVIGSPSAGRSFLGWLAVLLRALSLILQKNKNYPRILILEMGADKPGDIDYLTAIAKPSIALLTAIGPAHLESFGSLEAVAMEKSKIIKNLDKENWAVLNYDDNIVFGLKTKTVARTITYGLKEGADVRATGVIQDKETGFVYFQLNYNGSTVPVVFNALAGKPAVYSALAAAAVAIAMKKNLLSIAEKLKNLQPAPGRLNLIFGIKQTRIIDDSYNSSPLALTAALEVLSHLHCQGSKYAVLGDMLELGNHSLNAHKNMGEEVARLNIDYLILVGERCLPAMESAEKNGMNRDRIFHFDYPEEAGRFIQDRIQSGDLILVKGSRAMRLEKIVKEIMAEPEKAEELLVN